MRNVTPRLNGSVLLFLICTETVLPVGFTETSSRFRAFGSERDVVGEVYSETLKRPKKARRTADSSMSRSKCASVRTMYRQMIWSSSQVIGVRVGLLKVFPCAILIPLRTYSRRAMSAISLVKPVMVLQN